MNFEVGKKVTFQDTNPTQGGIREANKQPLKGDAAAHTIANEELQVASKGTASLTHTPKQHLRATDKAHHNLDNSLHTFAETTPKNAKIDLASGNYVRTSSNVIKSLKSGASRMFEGGKEGLKFVATKLALMDAPTEFDSKIKKIQSLETEIADKNISLKELGTRSTEVSSRKTQLEKIERPSTKEINELSELSSQIKQLDGLKTSYDNALADLHSQIEQIRTETPHIEDKQATARMNFRDITDGARAIKAFVKGKFAELFPAKVRPPSENDRALEKTQGKLKDSDFRLFSLGEVKFQKGKNIERFKAQSNIEKALSQNERVIKNIDNNPKLPKELKIPFEERNLILKKTLSEIHTTPNTSIESERLDIKNIDISITNEKGNNQELKNQLIVLRENKSLEDAQFKEQNPSLSKRVSYMVNNPLSVLRSASERTTEAYDHTVRPESGEALSKTTNPTDQFDTTGKALGKLSFLAKQIKDEQSSAEKAIAYENGEYTIVERKSSNKAAINSAKEQIQKDMDAYISLASEIGISVTDRPLLVPIANSEKLDASSVATLMLRLEQAGVLDTQTLSSYEISITAQQFAGRMSEIIDLFNSPNTKAILTQLIDQSSPQIKTEKHSLKEGAPAETTFSQLMGLEEHSTSIPTQAEGARKAEQGFIDNPDKQIKVFLEDYNKKVLQPQLNTAQELYKQHVENDISKKAVAKTEEKALSVQNKIDDKAKETLENLKKNINIQELDNVILSTSDLPKQKTLQELKRVLTGESPPKNEIPISLENFLTIHLPTILSIIPAKEEDKADIKNSCKMIENLINDHNMLLVKILNPLKSTPDQIKMNNNIISGKEPLKFSEHAGLPSQLINKTSEAVSASTGIINKVFKNYCEYNYAPTFIDTVKSGNISADQKAWNDKVIEEFNKQGIDGKSFIEGRKKISDACENYGRDPTVLAYENVLKDISEFQKNFPPGNFIAPENFMIDLPKPKF